MSPDRVRQILVVGGVVFALVLNGAANALPINGLTTAEIAGRFRVHVVPASYVYAIWGLIYIGQIAFLVQTLRPSRLADPLLRRIGLLPALIGVLNGSWILLWHYELFVATLVVMVALLLSLIRLYRRANFAVTARPGSGLGRSERWLVQVPFSLYLGWITGATIANVAAVASWAGVLNFGIEPQLVAAILLALGLVIAIAVMLRTGDVAYGAAIIWAHGGIVVQELATPWVPLVAVAAVVIMAELVVVAFARRLPLNRPQSG